MGVCRKSHSKQWSETAVFCDIVTHPLGFPTQLSISLYLLPVLRGRFHSNAHVSDWFCDHCTPMKLRHKPHRCDIFEMSETENGKMIR